MGRILKRTLLAAVLSLACFFATSYWYARTQNKNGGDANQKPVAYLAHTKDETLRRPVTRVIWQLINDGEPVFPGEAIRTSSEGEARIQFADSKRFIDLEPDSLIVISKSSDNEIALDLMDGSLMVNQGTAAAGAAKDEGESAGPALTLRSGNAKVDLSKATASLSKSSSGRIDLQVMSGKADVEGSGDLKRVDQDSIQILSPLAGKIFYYDPKKPQPVAFAWRGFPAKSLVTLESGKQRTKLKPLGETADEKITLPFTAGKHYWKLVARNPSTKAVVGESALFRLEVASRSAPVLYSPAQDEEVPQANAHPLGLKWNRTPDTRETHVEIATDEAFKNKIWDETFKTEDGAAHDFKQGEYFARLSARFENSDQVLTGEVSRFRVSAKAVVVPVAVRWTRPEGDGPLFYATEPGAQLGWATEQKDQVKSWRVKFAASEAALEDSETLSFASTKTEDHFALPKAGTYFAQVQALSDHGRVLASSPVRKLDVAPLPLLPAPKFEAEGDMNADPRGNLALKWTPVEGAEEYVVTLYDKAGNELKKARFKKNSTALQNLLPGDFQVDVVAIDGRGRKGESEPPRNVRVPASSGLAAPKFKRIKVN